MKIKKNNKYFFNKDINNKLSIENYKKKNLIVNATNISWFNKRITKSNLERSINTLLPDNGKTHISNYTIAKKFIIDQNNEFTKLKSKYVNNKIVNPKYLFSKSNSQKIKQLRDLFLEFDKDFSRKLEINELYDMFKTNNIPVKLEELIMLFFNNKNKSLFKKTKSKYLLKVEEEQSLNFYELIIFAFNLENELMFELFFRKLKKIIVFINNKKILCKNNEEENKRNNFNLNNYIPTTINLLFDFLNKKGNIRSEYDYINKAKDIIEEFNSNYKNIFNHIFDNNTYIRNQSNNKIIDKNYSDKMLKVDNNNNLNDFKNKKDIQTYLNQHLHINLDSIYNRFDNLVNKYNSKLDDLSNINNASKYKKINNLSSAKYNNIYDSESICLNKKIKHLLNKNKDDLNIKQKTKFTFKSTKLFNDSSLDKKNRCNYSTGCIDNTNRLLHKNCIVSSNTIIKKRSELINFIKKESDSLKYEHINALNRIKNKKNLLENTKNIQNNYFIN